MSMVLTVFCFFSHLQVLIQSEDKQEVGGWPLCHKGHLIVHLGEGESRTILRPGDVYLYVSNSNPTCVELKVKYRTHEAHLCEEVVEESQYLNVFSMDWPNSLPSSPEDFIAELDTLITAVENSIDRRTWHSVLSPTISCANELCATSEHQEASDKENCHKDCENSDLKSNDLCQSTCDKQSPQSHPGLQSTSEDDDGYHDESEINDQIYLAQLECRILHDETLILPGCVDVDGRAVSILNLKSSNDFSCTFANELSKCITYFLSTFNKETISKGLVLIIHCHNIDDFKSEFIVNLLNTLDAMVTSLHSLIFSVTAEVKQMLENVSLSQYSRFQVHVAVDLDELAAWIPVDQIPKFIGGEYVYDHRAWIQFKAKQEELINNGNKLFHELVNLVKQIKGRYNPSSPAFTNQVIDEHRKLVTEVLQNGPEMIKYKSKGKQLKKDLESIFEKYPSNRDFGCGVKICANLHANVEKGIRKVNKIAHKHFKKIDDCLQLKALEEELSQRNVRKANFDKSKNDFVNDQIKQTGMPILDFGKKDKMPGRASYSANNSGYKGSILLYLSKILSFLKKVLSWFHNDSEEELKAFYELEDDVKDIMKQRSEFEKFDFIAMVSMLYAFNYLFSYHGVFEREGVRNIEKARDLIKETEMFRQSSPENNAVYGLAKSVQEFLPSFNDRLEDRREVLEKTSKCYQCLHDSYGWSLNVIKLLSLWKVERARSLDILDKYQEELQSFLDDNPPLTPERFDEMSDIAFRFNNEKLKVKIQTARDQWNKTLTIINDYKDKLNIVRFQIESSAYSQCSDTLSSSSTKSFGSMGSPVPQLPHPCRTSTPCNRSERRCSAPAVSSHTSGPYCTLGSLSHALNRRVSEYEDSVLGDKLITEDLTEQGPVTTISKTLLETRSKENRTNDIDDCENESKLLILERKLSGGLIVKPHRKLFKRSNTWQDESHFYVNNVSPERRQSVESVASSLHSEDSTGIADISESKSIIQDQHLLNKSSPISNNVSQSNIDSSSHESLEKSKRFVFMLILENENVRVITSDNDPLVQGRKADRMQLAPVRIYPYGKDLDLISSRLKRQAGPEMVSLSGGYCISLYHRTINLIMKEMIQTERDYVSSLEYIIESYIPELLREDIPQALRGQRNVIFGNIEKIYEFHSRYFLQELEQCEPAPFLAGLCFLRYEPQFYYYALYNKNKPKCDNLMTEYGNQFFKKMQLELGDKMDLASYLLKPVQRMGKYALLLKQLLKECPESETEFQDLRAAEEMVRFQLRHGNDLLAMDALRECDVNVKEQGRLLRQDEFVVSQGKMKKSFRRVFLFEDLILFSKPRRDQENKGHEVYMYKNSMKMTDIGLTEQFDDSLVKFEIWFRKRKQHDIYLLQSQSPEVRQAWVQEISKELWKQALRNREMRLVEMSSMGIGSKPCLDIKPGEDQINDRYINMNFTKGSWLRRTTPNSAFDGFHGKRPHSIISISSSSSSGSSQSSQYGALNLGFENHDNSRSLYRSVTQHSQCSNESGICPDISISSLDNISSKNRKKAERSDSMMSTDSMMTHASGISQSGSINSNKLHELDEIVPEVSRRIYDARNQEWIFVTDL
ncbi:Puratrophin-1 [Nymphon striatum]|nr:Puratrophin-1 [Nymphon striatum]